VAKFVENPGGLEGVHVVLLQPWAMLMLLGINIAVTIPPKKLSQTLGGLAQSPALERNH